MAFSSDHPPILVTGATGHTGRRLVRRLLELGARVRCLIHTPQNRSRIPEHANLEVIYGSATEAGDLVKALEGGINTVLHLAHIRYAPILVEAIEKSLSSSSTFTPQTVRLIAMSSTRLLSRFPSPTREAVSIGENAIKSASSRVQWTIIRSSMIFGGPDDNNLERLAAQLRRSRFVPIFGSGQNLVQPDYVWDLVTAIVSCIEHPASIGHCYIIAGPQSITWREMVQEVARAAGAKPPIFIRLPYRLSLAAANLLKAIWPGFPLSAEFIERFGENRVFDIADACRDLQFSPTPFRKALEEKFQGKA